MFGAMTATRSPFSSPALRKAEAKRRTRCTELAIRVATVLVHDCDLVRVHELAPRQEAEWRQLAAMGASCCRGVAQLGHVVSIEVGPPASCRLRRWLGSRLTYR